MSSNKEVRERKNEVLNNSYRKDGLVKFLQEDYRGAIKMFTTVSVRPKLPGGSSC